MVALRKQHTFIVSHVPPEGDLMTDAELAGMKIEEAAFIADCYRAGMQKMHLRFRKELRQALEDVVAPQYRVQMRTGLLDGKVVLHLSCNLHADANPEHIACQIADLLPQVWERVANPKG